MLSWLLPCAQRRRKILLGAGKGPCGGMSPLTGTRTGLWRGNLDGEGNRMCRQARRVSGHHPDFSRCLRGAFGKGEGIPDGPAETRGSCTPGLPRGRSPSPSVPWLEAGWAELSSGLQDSVRLVLPAPFTSQVPELLPALLAPLHVPLHRRSHTAWGGEPH